MNPGYRPRLRKHGGRCLQLSTACALGLPWRDAPHGHDGPDGLENPDQSVPSFWSHWRNGLRDIGYTTQWFDPNGENEPDDFWIALVENGGFFDDYRNSHAVVMKGNKLWYDPNRERTQRPHKFRGGLKLIPNGNN